MSFDLGLAFTLRAEGGYVDDPRDSGGATNRGVTQSTYDTYRDIKHMPRQAVLLMTGAETSEIYDDMYWQPCHASQLPTRLGVCHFDAAVNLGIQESIKLLQRTLGVAVDGRFGPATAAAGAAADDVLAAQAYSDNRKAVYLEIVAAHPEKSVFLDGWNKRVDRLSAYVAPLTS